MVKDSDVKAKDSDVKVKDLDIKAKTYRLVTNVIVTNQYVKV